MARNAHSSAKAPSQRQLRVGEELRHALSQVLERGDIRDPRLEGVVLTVTEVRVSPDLKNATAFVIELGQDAGASLDVVEALKHAAPYLRREVAKRVTLKFAPRLSFQVDESFDEASRIDKLLADPHVAQDLAQDLASERDPD